MQRYQLLKRVLDQMGVEPQRVRLVWASAAEGVRLAREITNMVEEVRKLGPLAWSEGLARDSGRDRLEVPVSKFPSASDQLEEVNA
jgi:hypothetical protein